MFFNISFLLTDKKEMPSSFFDTPVVLETIENGQWVINTGYLFIGGAVFFLARFLLGQQESRTVEDNLESRQEGDSHHLLVRLLRPFCTAYIVPRIRKKPFWDKMRQEARRKLITSGVSDQLTPDEFIAFRLGLLIFFPLLGGFVSILGILSLSFLTVLGWSVSGWFYPVLWLNGRIKNRQKSILRSLPFIVDLLALSTEAGLDFIGAIGKVVEKAKPSPLVDDLSQLLKEIKVGSSRQEALREMSYRIGMMEINSFVSILISADQMGASIGKILRQQSEQIRSQRMLRAEKEGVVAAQKVLIPLVLFIVPSVFLLIFGPFLLGMLSSGGV